jgi:hypothetical protein
MVSMCNINKSFLVEAYIQITFFRKPIQKLIYVAFLHFESDEWRGMAVLDSADARLVCSDLSSTLNLTGWYNVPSDHISFWDNETLKMPQSVT